MHFGLVAPRLTFSVILCIKHVYSSHQYISITDDHWHDIMDDSITTCKKSIIKKQSKKRRKEGYKEGMKEWLNELKKLKDTTQEQDMCTVIDVMTLRCQLGTFLVQLINLFLQLTFPLLTIFNGLRQWLHLCLVLHTDKQSSFVTSP